MVSHIFSMCLLLFFSACVCVCVVGEEKRAGFLIFLKPNLSRSFSSQAPTKRRAPAPSSSLPSPSSSSSKAKKPRRHSPSSSNASSEGEEEGIGRSSRGKAVSPPYQPSQSDVDEDEDEGEIVDSDVESGRVKRTPSRRTERTTASGSKLPMTKDRIPRQRSYRLVNSVAGTMYLLWSDGPDAFVLDSGLENVYFVSSKGFVTCATQDWRKDSPASRCKCGPGEQHPHESLQSYHISDFCLRVIKRAYISGAGRVWDSSRWPKRPKSVLSARFAACRRWMATTLFSDIPQGDLNPFWLYAQDDKESTDETMECFRRYLKQGDTSNVTFFPTSGYKGVSKMHLPLPPDDELIELWTQIQEKWSNILKICRIEEWAMTEAVPKDKSRRSLMAPTQSLWVRTRGNGVDQIVPFTPRRLENRGTLAEIADDLLPENYKLPPGQRYHPVDGPLARRGCYLLPWRCKCGLLGGEKLFVFLFCFLWG